MYEPMKIEAQKLYEEPTSFACALENHELEKVICHFVTVLMERTNRKE